MYSFDLTAEQRLQIDSVNRFATRTLREYYRQAEEDRDIPANVVSTGWDLGLVPSAIPERYGGFGEYSALNGALVAEELSYGDMASALQLLSPNLVAIPILLCGSDRQKQIYLPMFCDVDAPRVASAFLEPTIMFDPAHLSTQVEHRGDDFLITGIKAMVINADRAELFLVYAHDVDSDSTQAYLVPADSPGLRIIEREHWMGFQALRTFRVAFEGVQVGHDQRLGGDAGIDLEMILNSSGIGQAALGVGVARGAYEYARDYAKQRIAFGEPIAHRQSIAFMLAEMAIEIDAARLMLWEAAWKIDHGKDATHDTFLAAQYASAMALEVTDNAVQVLGGHGYIREYPVELWLRNGRGISSLLGSIMV